jgi:hypothetical protein
VGHQFVVVGWISRSDMPGPWQTIWQEAAVGCSCAIAQWASGTELPKAGRSMRSIWILSVLPRINFPIALRLSSVWTMWTERSLRHRRIRGKSSG